MAPIPSAAPPPSAPGLDLGEIAGNVLGGLWDGVTSSAWTLAATALVLLSVAVRVVHAVAYPRRSRDPLRRFSRPDNAEILRRAGGRCEHHGLLGRCAETERLEADHVIPWSRSGPTIVGNGQALCRRHNRSKRATIPFRWQLRRLAKRRSTYFPPGASAVVVRRAGSTPR